MYRGLKALTLWFALIGAATALAVAAMVTWSVVTRAIWLEPIQGDVELTQMGIAIAISLCIPWCQYQGANIIVDFFTQRLAPATNRRLDALGCLLLAAMYALLAWRTSVGAMGVRQAFESTMILGLPMWWSYAALAPGLGLACMVALAQAWRHAGLAPMDEGFEGGAA